MSGPLFSGEKVPEFFPEETKEWMEDNKPLWKTSPFDMPGPEGINTGELEKIVKKICKELNVEEQEILIGANEAPPSDPAYLVYVCLFREYCSLQIYFRKDLKSGGIWMHKENPSLWGTSMKESIYEMQGAGCVHAGELERFARKISKAFDVDKEEILIGTGEAPPSDPTCLVYLRLHQDYCGVETFFRKNLKSDGRWVYKNYMHHINGSPEQKGTYDYRYDIAYI